MILKPHRFVTRFIVLISAMILLLVGCADQKSTRASGEKLANEMIRLSKGGTQKVDLRTLAEKLCFVPEGVAYAPAHAERLFPGFKVVYEENDASKGMWFLIVADGESNTTKIYAVKQDLLKWEIPQDEPVSRYITCPASVAIKYQNGRPEIDLRDNR